MNKATDRKTAERIFDRWSSSLALRQKSSNYLLENFDALFEELMYANVDPDLAEQFIKPAVTEHLPNKMILKITYKKNKNTEKYAGVTEQEFFESWKKLIEDSAKQAYYFRFPLPEPETKKEAAAGSMSKDEYMKQRRYANSFPSIDLSKIPDIEEKDDDVSFSMADLGE